MKVLELVESAAAGVGRHVVDLTAGLIARGHQVHLVYSGVRWDRTFAEEFSHALELGIPAARLSLIPNGVSLDQPRLSASARDALRRKWGLRDTEVCIGFVGRLASQKSPQTLLRSFAALLQRTAVPVR